MTGNTPNEKSLYGAEWNSVYGGYFSDAGVAEPLVRAIFEIADESMPSVIADLGGGTGFVLSELARSFGHRRIPRLVCVDGSRTQLDDCPEGLVTLQCAVEDVERSMLVDATGTLLLCLRSVLHYFGKEGLRPVLAHFRSALEEGEHLVHQTVCFEDVEDQETANLLYEWMDTGKWYPTVEELTRALQDEGLAVLDTRPAAPLALTSAELDARYGVGHERMEEIGRMLEGHCPEPSCVFVPHPEGFTAHLDYIVMTCVAS